MHIIKSIILTTAALAGAQAQAAYVFDFTAVPTGSYTAPAFADGVKASVQTSSITNVYLQPQGVTGSFLVVSNGGSSPAGSATINTANATSYSLVWGSPDTFNSIAIYGLGGSYVSTYTGADLKRDYKIVANGNNAETGLFTINATGSSVIDHLVLQSSGVAFEVAAAVPEPETYALMLAGLGTIGFVARRRKSV